MASIEDRPNGSVRVKWRVDGRQDGITVDDVADAKRLVRWLDTHGVRPSTDPDLLFSLGRQAPQPELVTVTVGEAIERMLRRPLTAHGKPPSEGTLKVYRRRQAILAPLHDVPVQRLTRADIDAFMAELISAGRLGESTWRGVAIVLQTALRPYGKAELCKGYAGRAKTRRRDPVVMTKATMDLVTALGSDHGIGDLLAILTDMGLRYGEAVAVDREHCALLGDRPFYAVRQQHPAVSAGYDPGRAAEPTKTDRGRRDVPMSPRLVELAERTPSGLLTVDGYAGRGPWRHRVANYRLARVSRVAIGEGIVERPLHFHDFRHSWGAHLLLGGTDIVTVSYLMGHSSVQITGDTYGHLTAQGLDTARALLK